LVGEALKQIARQDTTLEDLLQTSHTARGVYSRHLERHWRNLQSNPELACAFQKIVLANSPVEFNSQLNQSMAVKLNDLGLVKLSSNNATPVTSYTASIFAIASKITYECNTQLRATLIK
jgi:hypothetical protein